MKKLLAPLLLIVIVMAGHAQKSKIDSLLSVLKTQKEDSNKVITLTACGWELKNAKPDTAIILSTQALALAEKNKFEKGIGRACFQLGWIYYLKGNYPVALTYDFRALSIWERTFPPSGGAKGAALLSNIGSVYLSQNDFQKALANYFKALKIQEDLEAKSGIGINLGNIGVVYMQEALQVKTVNATKKDSLLNKALEYYQKALKFAEDLGDENGIAIDESNIGVVYAEKADLPITPPDMKNKLFSMALDYDFKALKISEKMKSKYGIAVRLGNIGRVYSKTGKLKDAEDYLLRALALSTEINSLDLIADEEQSLTQLYSKTGKHNLAFEHYKKYIIAKDSISNDENTKKQTQAEMSYEFAKQQTADSITNVEKIKQEELKHNQEIQQQKIYTYGGAIGFLLMIIVAGVSYNAYRQKQKANEVISKQKLIVEEKQKQILDSIHYAKRIQESLLPTEKYIDKSIKRLKK